MMFIRGARGATGIFFWGMAMVKLVGKGGGGGGGGAEGMEVAFFTSSDSFTDFEIVVLFFLFFMNCFIFTIK